jgi:hypothetical protein
MEKNKESSDGYIEKIAMITDAMENLFPTGQAAIIFELEEEDFKKIQSYFRRIDSNYKRFKIDISGVEVIFILKGYEPEQPKEEEVKKEESKLKKFINLFSSKKSS